MTQSEALEVTSLHGDSFMLALNEEIDAFGGFYLDSEGQPVVVLTPGADHEAVRRQLGPVLDAIRASGLDATGTQIVADFEALTPENLRFVSGAYTFRQLAQWRDLVRPVLGMPGVVVVDANERDNRVRVEVVDDGTAAAVREVAASTGVPSDALDVLLGRPIELVEELTSHVRPTRGGFRIQAKATNWTEVCSLGVNLTRTSDSAKFLVTASHCTKTMGSVDGDDIYQDVEYFGGNKIGDETADPAFTLTAVVNNRSCVNATPSGRLCRGSDAALAQYLSTEAANAATGLIGRTQFDAQTCTPGSNCSLTIAGTTPNLSIVGSLLRSDIGGLTLQKIGTSTGTTYGSMDLTCADFNLSRSGSDTGKTLLCGSRGNGSADNGDSGGPVTSRPTSLQGFYLVKVAGIVSAKQGTDKYIFSNWEYVASELNIASGFRFDDGKAPDGGP